jgi:peptide/nickel transport system ATP-binding protein
MGMSVILITHDLGVVAGRTNRVFVMYAGRVVEQADTSVLFGQTQHPYTKALMDSIPRVELDSHTHLAAIPGRPPDMVNPPPGCRFAPRCSVARPRCSEDQPPLAAEADPRHLFACFFPLAVSTEGSIPGSPIGASPVAISPEGGNPGPPIGASPATPSSPAGQRG